MISSCRASSSCRSSTEQRHGADHRIQLRCTQKDRITHTIRLSCIFAFIMMMLDSSCSSSSCKLLLLFNASEDMISIGSNAAHHQLELLVCRLLHRPSSVFQALGNGVYSLIVSVARQLFVLAAIRMDPRRAVRSARRVVVLPDRRGRFDPAVDSALWPDLPGRKFRRCKKTKSHKRILLRVVL